MKKHLFNKLCIGIVLIFILIVSTFFIGCQQDNKIEDSYKNLPYLSLSPNANYSKLSESD